MKKINFFPVLLISAVTVLIFLSGSLTELFELNKYCEWWQVWRLITGHFTHWGAEHLFYDLGMFTVLGLICVNINRKAFYILIFVIPFISSLIILNFSGITCYRGLSGIDTGLFTFLSLELIRRFIKNKKYISAGTAVLAVTMLLLKTCYEASTGNMIFVSEGFTLCISAHLTGIVCGFFIQTLKNFINIYPSKIIK